MTTASAFIVNKCQVLAVLAGTALEQMIQAYAANRLPEGAVVGSVWPDYAALRDAALVGGWNDETRMAEGVLGALWPHGTPPDWPE